MSVSDSELQQRQQAARTHGAYSFRDRGESALTEDDKKNLQEIRDKVETREGVLSLMQENAARAMLIADMLTSFVAIEAKAGVPLEEIKALNKLPAFYNTAQRSLKDLLDNLPPEAPQNAELEKIKQVIESDNA